MAVGFSASHTYSSPNIARAILWHFPWDGPPNSLAKEVACYQNIDHLYIDEHLYRLPARSQTGGRE